MDTDSHTYIHMNLHTKFCVTLHIHIQMYVWYIRTQPKGNKIFKNDGQKEKNNSKRNGDILSTSSSLAIFRVENMCMLVHVHACYNFYNVFFSFVRFPSFMCFFHFLFTCRLYFYGCCRSLFFLVGFVKNGSHVFH